MLLDADSARRGAQDEPRGFCQDPTWGLFCQGTCQEGIIAHDSGGDYSGEEKVYNLCEIQIFSVTFLLSFEKPLFFNKFHKF